MPKDEDSFFEEDEVDETSDAPNESDKDKKPPKKETKPTPPPDSSDEDKTDWKAKYEGLEKKERDRKYYDELLDFDDSLEGEDLDTLTVGKRYRELRDLGLSAAEAYGAVSAQTATAPEKSGSNKSHVSPPGVRPTAPKSRMSREEREMLHDLLPDLSDEELEKYHRRVSGKT